MEISERLSQIKGSATAMVFAKAKDLEAEGKDIIHLEIGQPDYAPPDAVLEATIQALREKKTAYTVSRGIEELRLKIAKYHQKQNHVDLNHKTEVIVTAGGKIAIFASLWAVCNPGDNVIILDPSWVSYADIVESLGGEAKYIGVGSDFDFDETELLQAITEHTKALILNSPSNPTGDTISRQNLEKLVEICKSNDILIISDEIYCDYLYDGAVHHSLMSVEHWKDVGVVINGFSKTFSMTGFRLGYVLGRKQIIDEVNKVMQLTSSCPVNFAQHGALVALDHIDEMKAFIDATMSKRRQIIVELLHQIGVDFNPPQGSIYAWIKIPSSDSVEWANQLLLEQGVALTPGRAFGPHGESYVRICFAADENVLREGIHRIGKFINK